MNGHEFCTNPDCGCQEWPDVKAIQSEVATLRNDLAYALSSLEDIYQDSLPRSGGAHASTKALLIRHGLLPKEEPDEI